MSTLINKNTPNPICWHYLRFILGLARSKVWLEFIRLQKLVYLLDDLYTLSFLIKRI